MFWGIGVLGVFGLFQYYYARILSWVLDHKLLFCTVPVGIVICGVLIFKQTGKEFMPSLNEGSFLLMPTSLPHAGVEENKRVLQQLDMAVALSMYENTIQYKPEYMLNERGNRQRFKVNKDGLFELKNERAIIKTTFLLWILPQKN